MKAMKILIARTTTFPDWTGDGVRLCPNTLNRFFGDVIRNKTHATLVVGNRPRKGALFVRVMIRQKKITPAHPGALGWEVQNASYTTSKAITLPRGATYPSAAHWIKRVIGLPNQKISFVNLYLSVEEYKL